MAKETQCSCDFALTKDERQSLVYVKVKETLAQVREERIEHENEVGAKLTQKYLGKLNATEKEINDEISVLHKKLDKIRKEKEIARRAAENDAMLAKEGMRINGGYYGDGTLRVHTIDVANSSPYEPTSKSTILALCLEMRNSNNERIRKVVTAGTEILASKMLSDERIREFLEM